MIIEGIISTETVNGAMHLAPIGPHVDFERKQWTIKPFQSSQTFQNFHRNNRAVFHVTDDALLLCACLLGVGNEQAKISDDLAAQWHAKIQPRFTASFDETQGWTLQSACEAFSLQATQWDTSHPRATADCRVQSYRTIRPFWGWNRAKHSLVELAVLVSRLHILPPDLIKSEFARHSEIIDKTAGEDERQGLELLTLALSR